jgi:hypothetical protein
MAGISSYDRWATQTPEEYYGTTESDECDFNCAECGGCDIKVAELSPIGYQKFISHIRNLGEAKCFTKRNY